MAAENSINYALRVIKPVLDGDASAADVKPEAEQRYVDRIQAELQQTVWNSGCQSWYGKDTPGGRKWFSISYPWTQAHFWYRSLFPVWSDWQYSVGSLALVTLASTGQRALTLTQGSVTRKKRSPWAKLLLASCLLCAMACVMLTKQKP